jgi:hypothetical protein
MPDDLVYPAAGNGRLEGLLFSPSIEKDWLFGRTSDTSSGDSLKGGNAEHCDSMGTQLRSGLNILHRNVTFASAKKRELFDFSLVPCSLVGLRSRRRYISSKEREADESLRRNIIMAKSARSTQNCSVASGAGAIPRIHAEKGRQAKGCTVYRGLPDSHCAPPRNDFAPQGRTERD